MISNATNSDADFFPTGIAAAGCLTALGDAGTTVDALLAGRRGLRLEPVLGRDGGDPVPLALMRPMDEQLPPRWLADVERLAAGIPPGPWGTATYPAIVTSSNFGVGSLYAYTRDHNPRHLEHGVPFAAVDLIRRHLGWGEHVNVLSHACVSAHLGLAHGARLLHAGMAERVLVFSFDFVSPFVSGGFHSLKILNAGFPEPYGVRATGSIGLGDGAAFAVLTKEKTPFRIEADALYNEMHHFTGNQPDGRGFAAAAAGITAATRGRKVWVKGHGTGTLEAGRLEAEAFAQSFPAAPLVSWKGSLGHTLGSCGLVELALTMECVSRGTVPGTVGSGPPTFTDNVALAPFAASSFDGAVLASNAFGGAHAALLLTCA